jgi:hypothetical protein
MVRLCRCDRGVGAHSHLLAAAAAAEAAEQYAVEADSAAAAAARADAADAFSLLGRWYMEHGSDVPRAAKCCQRALALDPSQVSWVTSIPTQRTIVIWHPKHMSFTHT